MDSIETSDTYEKYIGKLNLNLAIFWGSFFVFVFCAGVLQVHIIPLFIPLNILQTLSILAMVYASFNLVQFNVKNEVVGILIFCYFAWCFYIIFNGFVYEYDFIKYQIFGGFLKYFFPIVLFFPKTIRFYKFQFNVVFFGAVGFILINLIFFEQVTTNYEDNVNEKFTFEGFVKNLGISIGFILFTFIYHSKIKVTISLVGLFMIIGIATYRARRAVMLVAIVHLMIFLLIFFIYTHRKILVSLFFLLFTLLAASYANMIYKENRNFFSEIEDRKTADTRTNVEVLFRRDFEPIDWAFGRGINGMYWCPSIDINNTIGYRAMIETEYLNIILKGGILHLGMLLLFMIPAMYNNLFRSKNLLSKASGIWIFLWILSLYPMNVFNFDLNYILVWTSVCIGFSPEIRNMSDEKLKKLLAG